MANHDSSLTRKTFSYVYDFITATISLSDLATDLMVLVEFYQKEEKVFFYASLTIILLAQFAYCVAFVIKYDREHEMSKSFLLTLLLLPIAPIISFLFYFLDGYDNSNFTFCGGFFALTFYKNHPDASRSLLKQWMQEKLSKHLGFILEAACEAFPQSILQMIAIVYYGEANILSITSIIISMFSVASKSFVFAVAAAIDMKTLVFNWLCAVTDFFGIFFAVSWVFYDHNRGGDDENSGFEFNFISTLWFVKYVSCVLPIVFFGSIGGWGLGLEVVKSHYMDRNTPACKRKVIYFFGCIVIFILWIFGLVTSSILLEIACFIYVANLIHGKSTSRFPSAKLNADKYNELLDWCVKDAKRIELPHEIQNVIDWNDLYDNLDKIDEKTSSSVHNTHRAIDAMKRQLSGSKNTPNYNKLDPENENKENETIDQIVENVPSKVSINEQEDKKNSAKKEQQQHTQKQNSSDEYDQLNDKGNDIDMDTNSNELEYNPTKEYVYTSSNGNGNNCLSSGLFSCCGGGIGNDRNKTVLTKEEDRLLKLCCVNILFMCSDMISTYQKDEIQGKYLIEQSRNAFKDVTYQSLRANTRAPERTKILRGIFTWYSGIYLSEKRGYKYWVDREKTTQLRDDEIKSKMARYYSMKFSFVFFYIFGPVYLFSRLINFLFPFFILLYVYINNLWSKIDLFQWSMMFTYACCVIVVLILLILVLYHQYHFFHIIATLDYIPRFDYVSSNPIVRRRRKIEILWLLTKNSFNRVFKDSALAEGCFERSRTMNINMKLREEVIANVVKKHVDESKFKCLNLDTATSNDFSNDINMEYGKIRNENMVSNDPMVVEDRKYTEQRDKIIKDIILVERGITFLDCCKKYYNLLLNYRIGEICIKEMFDGDIGAIIWQYCDDSMWIDEINMALMAIYANHQKNIDKVNKRGVNGRMLFMADSPQHTVMDDIGTEIIQRLKESQNFTGASSSRGSSHFVPKTVF